MHEHEHDLIHEHEHTHEHEHEHTHEHEHDHGETGTLAAVLKYMLEHNIHHADELKDIAEKLREQGQADAAEALVKSTVFFDAANEKLADALAMLP